MFRTSIEYNQAQAAFLQAADLEIDFIKQKNLLEKEKQEKKSLLSMNFDPSIMDQLFPQVVWMLDLVSLGVITENRIVAINQEISAINNSLDELKTLREKLLNDLISLSNLQSPVSEIKEEKVTLVNNDVNDETNISVARKRKSKTDKKNTSEKKLKTEKSITPISIISENNEKRSNVATPRFSEDEDKSHISEKETENMTEERKEFLTGRVIRQHRFRGFVEFDDNDLPIDIIYPTNLVNKKNNVSAEQYDNLVINYLKGTTQETNLYFYIRDRALKTKKDYFDINNKFYQKLENTKKQLWMEYFNFLRTNGKDAKNENFAHWTSLKEVIQNSINAKGNKKYVYFDGDTLKFRHTGKNLKAEALEPSPTSTTSINNFSAAVDNFVVSFTNNNFAFFSNNRNLSNESVFLEFLRNQNDNNNSIPELSGPSL